jgi:hypothetical protein
MELFSHEFIYFIRAILFGVAVGYAFFYVLFYIKPIAENIAGVKHFDVNLWWIMTVSVSILAGIVAALFLM